MVAWMFCNWSRFQFKISSRVSLFRQTRVSIEHMLNLLTWTEIVLLLGSGLTQKGWSSPSPGFVPLKSLRQRETMLMNNAFLGLEADKRLSTRSLQSLQCTLKSVTCHKVDKKPWNLLLSVHKPQMKATEKTLWVFFFIIIAQMHSRACTYTKTQTN